MNLSTTRLNTIVGIVGIAIGLDFTMLESFFFQRVQWEIFFPSIALFIVTILLKKRTKLPPPPPPISNFTAQLGNSENSELLKKAQRLAQLKKGQNPYLCGTALPENSAVFYGRARELGGTLSVLGNPDKPGNVSLLGEQRIGKSSLLNQIYQVLATKPNVVTIHTTMQDWSIDSQATFFNQLHQAISEVLKIKSDSINDYAGFRYFIRNYAEKGFRFVLMIDGFEKMTKNAFFDATFFSNMRALGERHEYQFAYVLSSYTPLYDICHQGDIQESKFWNIFGTCYILGLLAKKEAEQLIQEPMRQALGRCFKDTAAILTYTGYHPAFIQIVASEYCNANYVEFALNKDAIQQSLHNYYKNLWECNSRSSAEQELLLKIAKHEIFKDNAILMNLRQRGLVDDKNQLFSPYFKIIINEFTQ